MEIVIYFFKCQNDYEIDFSDFSWLGNNVRNYMIFYIFFYKSLLFVVSGRIAFSREHEQVISMRI